jgi:phosphoesterase RecJ-like protein
MKLKEISELLSESRNIAIMGHKAGDSDCYGSAFALALALTKLGKNVSVITEESFPEALSFLFFYYNGDVVTSLSKTDLLFALDASDVGRLWNPELARKLKASGAKVVHLDHHQKGDFADFADISITRTSASATSEIVYDLITNLGIEIDKNIATCLLTGIIGDTSGFQNQNTSEESFAIASELMKRGARLKSIVDNTFGGKEVDVLKVWGLAMERLVIDKKYGVVSTYLTHEDIESYGLSIDAVSGIVNFLNSIKGARVVMLITEEDKGMIKVSLRTRDTYADVSAIARQLGGGGHVKAAGFTFPGTLKTLTQGSKSHIVIS